MSNKYKIDPDFVVPEPTPADRFCSLSDPGLPDERRKKIDEVFTEWREEGKVKRARVTVTGPDIEGDDTGYPPGLWFEGWEDENARQLPFGSPWPNEDSAIWPPLIADEKLRRSA